MLKAGIRKVYRFFTRSNHEWFSGNYASFDQARAACTGYDAPAILEKVRTALLKVKRGEAVYERDSVLFNEIQYSLPLLSFLLYAASASNNKLNILDFGGSLGSTYFQNRKFLNRLSDVKWSIVEQPNFYACGKRDFEDEKLHFFPNILECVQALHPNTLLLSSVLPYLPSPHETLREMLDYDFEFIIIDRTPFFRSDLPDRLTIEHVPAEIYEAKYPAWFFNKKRFISALSGKYELYETMPANDKLHLSDAPVDYLAMLFTRKKNA